MWVFDWRRFRKDLVAYLNTEDGAKLATTRHRTGIPISALEKIRDVGTYIYHPTLDQFLYVCSLIKKDVGEYLGKNKKSVRRKERIKSVTNRDTFEHLRSMDKSINERFKGK